MFDIHSSGPVTTSNTIKFAHGKFVIVVRRTHQGESYAGTTRVLDGLMCSLVQATCAVIAMINKQMVATNDSTHIHHAQSRSMAAGDVSMNVEVTLVLNNAKASTADMATWVGQMLADTDGHMLQLLKPDTVRESTSRSLFDLSEFPWPVSSNKSDTTGWGILGHFPE